MAASVDVILLTCAMAASAVWCVALFVPLQLFTLRERLQPQTTAGGDLSAVTVLIPARNEAAYIQRTLDCLRVQGTGLGMVLVDDQSTDGTAAVASSAWPGLSLVEGTPPPPGWMGKVWALEQGLDRVQTAFVMLLDADIELRPGVVAALHSKASSENLALVSILAKLRSRSLWERFFVPAYVYFFRLLYPFFLVNKAGSPVAAAAGGCILVRREVLNAVGGFGALKRAIIDDCTLAGLVKGAGHRIWLGVSDSVISHRAYRRLSDIWALVTRSAFAELKFSLLRLLSCSLAMLGLFTLPLLSMILYDGLPRYLGLAGSVAMFASYIPVLRFYSLGALRSVSLPVVALAYLVMTWHSAARYWCGTRTVWKGRSYQSGTGQAA